MFLGLTKCFTNQRTPGINPSHCRSWAKIPLLVAEFLCSTPGINCSFSPARSHFSNCRILLLSKPQSVMTPSQQKLLWDQKSIGPSWKKTVLRWPRRSGKVCVYTGYIGSNQLYNLMFFSEVIYMSSLLHLQMDVIAIYWVSIDRERERERCSGGVRGVRWCLLFVCYQVWLLWRRASILRTLRWPTWMQRRSSTSGTVHTAQVVCATQDCSITRRAQC